MTNVPITTQTPVPNTKLSVANFGAPVVNDLNALAAAAGTQPCAFVGRVATAQAIPDAIFTDVVHDTEFADNDGMWGAPANLSRVTILHAGYYMVAAGVTWASNGTGVRVCAVSVNGAIINEISDERAALAGNERQTAAGGLVLAVNDIVRINVFQNRGGGLTLNCNARLSVVRVSGP